MRWAALILALSVAGLASCRGSLPTVFVSAPVPKYVIPATIPGWWALCIESPSMNWERPGEPKVGGWTTCTGTVDQLRDKVNQIRTAGLP